MPITRLCPGCGKANQVAVTQVGTKVRCYACGDEFKVKSSDTTVRRRPSKPHPKIPPIPKVSPALAIENAERELKRSKPPPDVKFDDPRIEVLEDKSDSVEEVKEEDKATEKVRKSSFPGMSRRRREREAATEPAPIVQAAPRPPANVRRGFNRLGVVLGIAVSVFYLLLDSDHLIGWSSAKIVAPAIDKYILAAASAAVLFLTTWLVLRLAGWAAKGFQPDE